MAFAETISERQAAIGFGLPHLVPWTQSGTLTGGESAVALGTYPLTASTDEEDGGDDGGGVVGADRVTGEIVHPVIITGTLVS